MIESTFDLLLSISLIIISIATLGLVYRVIKGPSIPDRVMALDSIGINLIAITAITSIMLKNRCLLRSNPFIRGHCFCRHRRVF